MIDNISSGSVMYSDNRSEIVFSEKRSTYKAINKSRKDIIAYKIDGGMITAGNKCDRGLGVPGNNVIYLVELKGGDISHACVQIDATINFLLQRIGNSRIEARIVATKVSTPEIQSSQFKLLSRKVRGMKGRLECKSSLLEEEI